MLHKGMWVYVPGLKIKCKHILFASIHMLLYVINQNSKFKLEYTYKNTSSSMSNNIFAIRLKTESYSATLIMAKYSSIVVANGVVGADFVAIHGRHHVSGMDGECSRPRIRIRKLQLIRNSGQQNLDVRMHQSEVRVVSMDAYEMYGGA